MVSPLLASLIGGLVAIAVTAYFRRQHDLLMKRELYREILYREKVVAYSKVYALACGFIQDHEHLTDPTIDELLGAYERSIVVKKEVENCGLFMPAKVLAAVGTFEEISLYIMDHPALYQKRVELEFEPPEELLIILTFTDQLKSVIKILRDDLAVEELTTDLNEFFRTASLKPRWAKYGKQILEKMTEKIAGCYNKQKRYGNPDGK